MTIANCKLEDGNSNKLQFAIRNLQYPAGIFTTDGVTAITALMSARRVSLTQLTVA
jgi:hypothetical protein